MEKELKVKELVKGYKEVRKLHKMFRNQFIKVQNMIIFLVEERDCLTPKGFRVLEDFINKDLKLMEEGKLVE